MSFLRRLNPLRPLADLRRFLLSRGKHEIIFLFAAFAVCYAVLAAFVFGSQVDKPWVRPEIIYVQSWPSNRSDADIRAQQKVDAEKKKVDDAAEAKFQAEKRAGYKRLKDRWDWLL